MSSNSHTQVTLVLAKAKHMAIDNDMTSAFWKQLPLNQIKAFACRDRMREIIMSGKDASMDGDGADVISLL